MYLLYVKIQRVTVNMQNHTFQTLYGTDNVDNIRQWNMKVVEYPTYSEMIITHGVLNCKHIETIIKVEKGKNIGKKNERTKLSFRSRRMCATNTKDCEQHT
jgi:hypothetical protein